MEKSKTFRNLFAIIKWECYNKQTCRVEINSAVILVLTTGSFLMAWRRFLATRVASTKAIYCDTATYFVGAQTELKHDIKLVNEKKL